MVKSNNDKRLPVFAGTFHGEPMPRAMIQAFFILGIVSLIAGLLLAGQAVWSLFSGPPNLAGFAQAIMLLVFGAVLLCVRRLVLVSEETQRTMEGMSLLLTQNLKANGPNEVVIADIERLQGQLEQANTALGEITENLLLDEAGRRQKAELLTQERRRQALAGVDRLIQDREWAQARALLENLLIKFPQNREVEACMSRLENSRKLAFNEELISARKHIADLIAISAWDRAIRLAENLLDKHPDMPAAQELTIHVRAERNKFREDQIKRMYGDIQRSIGKKRWNDALSIAKQLSEKYPDSVEAESLREQMPTLTTNAEIERRQELEEQIKDLVRRRNFIQAMELARYVIDNYPTSPQASALRGQIDRLEELSRQQEKEIQL